MTPRRSGEKPVWELRAEATHSSTATTVTAASIMMPFFWKKFFITFDSLLQSNAHYASSVTPNSASIRLSNTTGRPMTLKKSPSMRSTSSAPCPCTPWLRPYPWLTAPDEASSSCREASEIDVGGLARGLFPCRTVTPVQTL